MTRIDEFHRLRAIETDDCVVWPYGRNALGYGQIRIGGRSGSVVRTHRMALVMASCGLAPEGMVAAHGPCHNRACMNPRHLRWATRSENGLDMNRDGTSGRGGGGSRAKLTHADVTEIRVSDERTNVLAIRYGVTPQHVRNIRRGSAWRAA